MSLTRLLQQLQDSSDSDSDSDDDSSDDGTASLVHLLALASAARASTALAGHAGDTGEDAVARALAGLVVMEGLREVLSADDGSIKTGDLVRLKANLNTMKRLQQGHGGWNTDMIKDMGKIGSVVKMADNGDAVVHFGKKTWRLNPDTCSKVTADEKKAMYSMGDRVYVEFSDDIAKEMQKSHGGWNSLMSGDLQKMGRVMGVDGDGDVSVQFWTRCWRVNSGACKQIITETGGTYKVGDEIFLDNDVDIDVLKSMQDGHGAWNPHIVQDLGHVGEVIAIDSDGDLHVKMGKHKWFLYPMVCTKILRKQSPGGEFFAVGDTVKIELPVDLVKDMQKDHGNWADGIAQDIGKPGKVIGLLAKGDIHVQFGNNKWRLNAAVCTKQSAASKTPFMIGQRVIIDMEPEKFLRTQIGHGGVNASMLTDLGKIGKILEILPDKDLMVQFTPNMWSLNPAICTKLSDMTKPKFSAGDQVFIGLDVDIVKMLQEGHGGFTDTMYRLLGQMGRVGKIRDNGDIIVLYGLLPMILNPAIVSCFIPEEQKVDGVAAQAVDMCPFSVGDLIRIDMDIQQVKKQQEGHGGWNDRMLQLLGKVGMVEKVDSDGDLKVCFGNVSACLNPAICSQAKTDTVVSNAAQTLGGDTVSSGSDTTTDAQASGVACGNCKQRNITVVFGCGHATCEPCSKKLKNCYSCQAQITLRTNLFF